MKQWAYKFSDGSYSTSGVGTREMYESTTVDGVSVVEVDITEVGKDKLNTVHVISDGYDRELLAKEIFISWPMGSPVMAFTAADSFLAYAKEQRGKK